MKKQWHSTAKLVVCVETGEVFKSILYMSKKMGFKHSTNIHKMLSGKRKKAYGLTFMYFDDDLLDYLNKIQDPDNKDWVEALSEYRDKKDKRKNKGAE